MKTRSELICRLVVLSGLIQILAVNSLSAQETAGLEAWRCIRLLDQETRSALAGTERFFAGLFQLPGGYERASQQQKQQLISRWLKQLQDSNSQTVAEAAACLGMAKAKNAAKALEKVIASGRGGGRPRWISTRSLGQIGDKASIPVLIDLLDNSNRETCIYAKVSLAEITGEYFGSNKQDWQNWSEGKVDDAPGPNVKAANMLRQVINEKYSYRDMRGMDWDRLFERHMPLMAQSTTPQQFAEVAARMTGYAKDMHLWVKIGNKSFGSLNRQIDRNYNIQLLEKTVPQWRDISRYVSMGRLEGGIGYIMIKSWTNDRKQVLEPALKVLRSFSRYPALIVDIRPNGGGSETLAREFAGCFVDHPVVYASHIYRDSHSPEGWGQVQKRILEPNRDYPQYNGRVAVLMGQGNMSSCEAFILMMKQAPNCKLIGDKSYGSSGNPKPYDLGNGVTVWLPSWKALRADGSCFEGQGLKPEIYVKTTQSQLSKQDQVLEKTLEYLRTNPRNGK